METAQLKDLAFVYVGLARGTDSQFHFRELEMIAILLTRRPTEIFDDSVDVILRLIPRHQHQDIFGDLNNIACADRIMLVEERTCLQRIERALGL